MCVIIAKGNGLEYCETIFKYNYLAERRHENKGVVKNFLKWRGATKCIFKFLPPFKMLLNMNRDIYLNYGC